MKVPPEDMDVFLSRRYGRPATREAIEAARKTAAHICAELAEKGIFRNDRVQSRDLLNRLRALDFAEDFDTASDFERLGEAIEWEDWATAIEYLRRLRNALEKSSSDEQRTLKETAYDLKVGARRVFRRLTSQTPPPETEAERWGLVGPGVSPEEAKDAEIALDVLRKRFPGFRP